LQVGGNPASSHQERAHEGRESAELGRHRFLAGRKRKEAT
jgi:hypothetical protein